MAAAEFHVEGAFAGDRRTPVRWVWSHVARHKWPLFWLFSGALTNAAKATRNGRNLMTVAYCETACIAMNAVNR